MRQWGAPVHIDNATFLPLVDTPQFQPIDAAGKIEDIFMVEAHSPKAAVKTLERLKRDYIGQPYSDWRTAH